MHPILFTIGPLTIYTYGFFVFLGVLCGYLVSSSLAKKDGIESNIFSNIIFWVIVFSFLGAKLLYLLIEWRYFLSQPLASLRSGFVFYGGIVSGLAALYFLIRKYKIAFLKLADILAIGVTLGHAFGRLGCFTYGCCFGRPEQGWLGLLFPLDSPAGYSGLKVIPTQLIEAGFLVLLFFLLLRLRNRKRFSGQVFLSYLIIYGVFRFMIEFLRGDFRGSLFFLSTSQLISLVSLGLGFWFYYRKLKQRFKP